LAPKIQEVTVAQMMSRISRRPSEMLMPRPSGTILSPTRNIRAPRARKEAIDPNPAAVASLKARRDFSFRATAASE
jgi:hypothetical protein